MRMRQLRASELSTATELCLRSKAYWGYDPDFMAACREELTLMVDDLVDAPPFVAIDGTLLLGVGQLTGDMRECHLEKLLVDPAAMGRGVGRELFKRAVADARALGATTMTIEADPQAADFYRRMGCRSAGEVPSGSIPGRMLPRLEYDLQRPERLRGFSSQQR